MIVGSVAGLGKSIFFARLLSVKTFGAFSLVILIMSYLSYLISLGIDMGFYRWGAIAIGKKYFVQFKVYTNHLLSFTLLSGIFWGVSILVAFRFLDFQIRGMEYVGFLGLSLVLFNFATTILRVKRNLLGFSSSLALRNLTALIFGSWAAFSYGLPLIIFSEVLSYLLFSIYIFYKNDIRIVLPQWVKVRKIIGQGAPFSLTNLLSNLSNNVDQWFIPLSLGVKQYGLYSFLMIFFTIGKGIINVVTQSIVPKIISDHARLKDTILLSKTIDKYILRILKFGLVSCILIGLGSYLIVPHFFPKFEPIKYLLPFILIGVLFYVMNLNTIFFLAVNHGRNEIVFGILNALFIIALSFLGYYFKQPLSYFAIIFMVTKIINFAIYHLRVKRILLN